MAKKSVINRIDRHLARRLREARQESGLSTRKVADKLPRHTAVSHATIASYEKGVTVPPVDVLGALADIYQRPLNWFLDSRESLTCFRYRNLKPRAPVLEKRQFEARAGKWVEAYAKLARHLGENRRKTRLKVPGHEGLSPVELAATVRSMLDLDDDQPVLSAVSALESFSALAMELTVSFGTDCASARRGRDFVVVFNPVVDPDRLRMNASHELAHLLYDDCKRDLGWTDDVVERHAYAFASSLLLPDSQLRLAFESKSFLRLIEYKERFGVSLATMIFRAEKDHIINNSSAKFLWKEMSRRGWRRCEPGAVWRDRAISFEMMLESAIHTKDLSWKDAERITGIREEELQKRVLEASRIPEQRDQEDGAELQPPILSFPFKSNVRD